MRVEFEFTQEEMIDVCRRSLERSKAVASFRRSDRVWFSLITAAFSFLLFFTKGWVITVSISAFTALIAALFYPAVQRSVMERRIRKLIQEKLDPNEPLTCEVELMPAGLWLRQGKTQLTHDWGGVESVDLLANGIEIITKGGALVVRNRAFKSENERQQFLHLAKSFLDSATHLKK